MGCSITIDLNTAQMLQDTAGSPPSSIQVSGAASECEKVNVYLVGLNPTTEVSATVVEGVWQAIFNAPNDFNPDDFPCGVADIKITAYCTDDPDCKVDTAIPVLNCVPRDCPPQATCIVYRDNNPNDLVDLAECLSPGLYTVAVIDPATPAASYLWSLNGVSQPAASGNGLNAFEITLAVGDDPQSVSVIVSLSTSGAACLLSTAATLLVCETPEPEECASEVEIQVSQINTRFPDLSGCLSQGAYTIAVTYPTGDDVSYGWSVDNGLQPGETGAQFNYTLLTGETHTIQVVAAQAGCPPVPSSVTLTACPAEPECAEEVAWQVVDGHRQPVDLYDDCLPPGRYTVVVQAPTGPTVSYRWILNGSEQPGESGSAYSVVLEADGNAEIGVIVQQSDCPEISSRLKLTGCEPPDERDCPGLVSLVVRDAQNNPVDPDDCQQPGVYSLQVTQPSSPGTTYTWSVDGQVQAGETTSTLLVSLEASDPVNVAVSVTPTGCPTRPAGTTLTPCQDDDDDDDEVVLPPPPSWCPILLISGLAAFFIGLVLIWAGMCTGNVPMAVVGGVLAVVGMALLIAWAFLCATKRGGCRIFARLLQILSIITIIFGIFSAIFGVIAAVCAVITSPGVITEIICAIPGACGLGAVIDFVLSGFLTAILALIFVEVCTGLTSSDNN
jgi:hypothetical protein